VGDPDVFTTQSFSITFADMPTNPISDASIHISALGDFSMTNNIEYLFWSVENAFSKVSFNNGGNDFMSEMYDSAIIPLTDLVSVLVDGILTIDMFVPSDVEPYSPTGIASYVTATVSYTYSVPEPATLWLLWAGMGFIGIAKYKKRNL
jgi:hypothetical protein